MGAEEDKKKKAAKMARRKQEVQLQQEIETTEEWEEMMAKEGLWVVDIYQEWCGPCAAMVGNFRRLKNELGDTLLQFAVAKADTVDALDKYRGRCEPCFLYFAGGMLVACVHGANSPVILRTITEQLAAEHKVLDGTSERKEMKDPMIAGLEEREKAQYDEDENEKEEDEGDDNVLDYRGERVNYGDTMMVSTSPDEEKKGFTVAIIKPDAVQSGKVEEILQQMEEAGIEVLAKEERQLTEEEAREFYSHLEGEEYFEDLVKFMSSGPSFALVLTKGQRGDDIIQEWRDMLGPTTVHEAKEQAPESLRAKYGGDRDYMNALHGSDSPETAAREMAFFFPNMSQPTIPRPGSAPKLQRTLALIRPDAFRTNKDAIMDKIKEAGFKVALQKEMTLTKEQAEEFYKEHADKPYFEELTNRMSSGPLLALGLAREDAVQGWRDQLGPTVNAKEEAPESLRAQFSVDDATINMLHGSDSPEAAEKEIEFFFPMQQTIAAIKPDAFGTKEDIIDKIHEAGFRIAARKETTITKEIAEEFYGEHKDKEYFNDLVSHMCSGPTMFMVLSREDAVSGWRDVIGPTNPDQAKEEAPESLRAKFGQSILQNAVHGSSDPNHAKESMEKVFGHLEFNPDGTVKGEEKDVIQAEPTKDEEVKAVEDTGAGEEAGDTAPEFKAEETEGDSEETKQQESSEETKQEGDSEETKQQESSEETKQEGDSEETKQQESSEDNEQGGTAQGDDGTKKDGDEAQPQTDAEQPKSEGDAEAKGDSGEEKTDQSETKTDTAEGDSEKKGASEDAADAGEGKGEDKTEESKGEEKAEESKTDDSKGEESKGGDSKEEETKGEETKGEETKGEETKGEETKSEETKGEEAKGEETKGEEAKGEESKGEETKGEETKGEETKDEETKGEESKGEETKGEEKSEEETKGEDGAKTEESEKKEDDSKKDDEAKTDDDKKEETKT